MSPGLGPGAGTWQGKGLAKRVGRGDTNQRAALCLHLETGSIQDRASTGMITCKGPQGWGVGIILLGTAKPVLNSFSPNLAILGTQAQVGQALCDP